MRSADALVYFLEESTVAAQITGWPAGMQLALCLTSDGVCDMAVHHEGEEARVLDRIAALYMWSREQISVVPQMDGFATRKVLFSQEQQLLSLVAESPHLAEMASDYAINFRFAQDEGLDADALTGATDLQPLTRGPRITVSSSAAAEEQRPADLTQPAYSSGCATPETSSRPECVFLEACLHHADEAMRLQLAPTDATGDEAPVTVTRIGYRDDFEQFILPLEAIGGWKPGHSAVLEMPSYLFPEALLARYVDAPLPCSVTVTARGVFVSLRDPARLTPSQPAPSGLRGGWRFPRPAQSALMGLLALMLVSGHFATARDTTTPEAWAYTPEAGADVALGLIALMASEEGKK